MTCLIEQRKVLEEFRAKQKAYFEIQKDAIAHEIFSSSLDRTFAYSASLEKQDLSTRINHQATRVQSPQETDPKKYKVVVFEASTGTFDFKKEQPKIDEALLRSSLSAALSKPAQGKTPAPPAGSGGSTEGVPITVHLPFGKVIKTKVLETATVEQVITFLIKHYPQQLVANSKAYVMRMAEEDGTPDEDFPPLKPEGPITKFGKFFALCKVGEGKEGKEGKDERKSLMGSEERRGSIGANSKPTLKVHLPNMQYIVLPWQENLKMGHILVKVCSKRLLDSSSHHFQLIDTPMAVNPEITLRDLGVTEVKLCSNK